MEEKDEAEKHAQANAWADHCSETVDKGSGPLFPPVDDKTLKWRDERIAAAESQFFADKSGLEDEYVQMYDSRTKAAYTNPIPAPLRIASCEHKAAVTSPAALGISAEPLITDKPTNSQASAPATQLARAVSADAVEEQWRNQPHDETGSAVRVWNADSVRTGNGKVLTGLSRRLPQEPAGIKASELAAYHVIEHPNVNQRGRQLLDWCFPKASGPDRLTADDFEPFLPPKSSDQSIPETDRCEETDETTERRAQSGARDDPWQLYALMKKLESLDDFFDVPPKKGQATLPRAARDEQQRHEAAFAAAAAEPVNLRPNAASQVKEAARRADNQTAAESMTKDYHDAMKRIAGPEWHPPQYDHHSIFNQSDEVVTEDGGVLGKTRSEGAGITPLVADASGAVRPGPGTPRRYTADRPNSPAPMTAQEQQREKVIASLRASKPQLPRNNDGGRSR